MARDRVNEWSALDFFDPTKVLYEARRRGFRHKLGGRTDLPREIAHSEKKVLTEFLDAAIFACGIRQMLPKRDVTFAALEDHGHDFVLRFGPADEPIYCSVQLKVFVSMEVNSAQTLETLFENLRKYGDAYDLDVAVKVDRPDVNPRTFAVPPLPIGGLWFFGPRPGTEDRWYLYGNCLDTPQSVEFKLFDGSP